MPQFDTLTPLTPENFSRVLKIDKKDATALVKRCFLTDSLPPSDCQVSWDDLEEFVLPGHSTCDLEKIVIDSGSFLFILKSKNLAAQKQCLKLAEAVNVSGNALAAHRIRDLIHVEKLSLLLPAYKQYIAYQSNLLKNNTPTKENFVDFNTTSLLYNPPISLSSSLQTINTSIFSFNANLADINKISLREYNLPNRERVYDFNVDFLSYEIRELLSKIESISLYKNPLEAKTIFIPHLKANLNLNPEEISWLKLSLDMHRFPLLARTYPNIFNDCQLSCFNANFSDKAIIRSVLVKLINSVSFKKRIKNYDKNVTTVFPYQSILEFKESELRIDGNKNLVANSVSNESIAHILRNYARLNQQNLNYRIIKLNTDEVIIIDQTHASSAQNDLTYASHLMGNEKIIIAGGKELKQLPLPDVTLYRNSKNQPKLLDFQILARQIKENFNASLLLKFSENENDVIIHRFFQYRQQNVSVIAVHLKDSLLDRWYQQLEIIPNLARAKIAGSGLTLHVQPLPHQIQSSHDTPFFFNLESLEENTDIFVPETLEDYSFFRIKKDLILSNALTSFIEGKKPYFLVLQDFYKEFEKTMTHTLVFNNKKILLSDNKTTIFNATEDWDAVLKERRQNLYTRAYQEGKPASRIVRSSKCYQPEYFGMDDFRKRRSATSENEQKFINLRRKIIQHGQEECTLKSDLTEADLKDYANYRCHKQALEKIIPLTISAWMGGLLSISLDQLGKNYQEKYPSLPAYMHYGFKPFLSALLSAGTTYFLFDQALEIEENFARFFTHFMFNFLGVAASQPLTQKIVETIANKWMSFLVQSLAWALLWNPSLFASEYFEIIPMIGIQLLQGLLFKIGEETGTLIKKTYNFSPSFWKQELKIIPQDPISNHGVHSMRR